MFELIEDKNIEGLLFYITVRIAIVFVCWSFMVVSSLVDFRSGVSTARALGERIDSKGFRRTITKIGDYAKVLIFALMIDVLGSFMEFYVLPFATVFATVAVISIELKSVIENGRRKKAHASEIPDVIKRIIQASTQEESEKVLDFIKDEMNVKGEK